MFLHDGLSHILFNMVALVSFGLSLERLWGTRRFLVFFLICGVGAGLVHTAVNAIEYAGIQRQLVEAGIPAAAIHGILEAGQTSPTLAVSPAALELLRELYGIHAVPMVGASGAIYGLLVAFGLTYPDARLALLFLPVPIAAKYVIPALVALDLLSGVTGFSLFGGGIAHFAHVGGALIGLGLMGFWRARMRRETPL